METTKVLLVCSGPGVRSGIAHAYLNMFEGFEAECAQYERRDGKIPEMIQRLMAETPAQIEPHFPPFIFEHPWFKTRLDYVIFLCQTPRVCQFVQESLEILLRKKSTYLFWEIEDFRSLSALPPENRFAAGRGIRDKIERHVQRFVAKVRAEKLV